MIIEKIEGGSIAFFCPGCKGAHAIPVEGPTAWTWNGSEDKPTISPSIRVRSGLDGKDVCHSNVTDGKITFHGDSTHALAGQTVQLPDFAL